MKLVKAFDKFVLLTKFMQYPLDIEKKLKLLWKEYLTIRIWHLGIMHKKI